MQTITRIFLLLISIVGLFFMANSTFAECGFFSWGGQCDPVPPYCQGNSCDQKESLKTIQVLLPFFSDKPISVYAQSIVTYLLSFISIVAVIYIIYAGFQVMTGAGDEEKMKKAKNIILYVVLGIIIMWLAYGIVSWVLKLIVKA